jgi:hypothetical protein
MFVEFQQTSLSQLLIFGLKHDVMLKSQLSHFHISASCTIHYCTQAYNRDLCQDSKGSNSTISVPCFVHSSLNMQLQAVTGAGMVENRRGTEAFHWLILVMKQHTAMDRFIGVSREPTCKL